MKIEEAMVYLLATSQHGMKTEQIADDLNFSSLAAFSKYFKQHTGKTPSEYRKG